MPTLHSAIKVLPEPMLLCKAFLRRLTFCKEILNTFAQLWTNISKIPHLSPQQFNPAFRGQPSVRAVRINRPRPGPTPLFLLRGEAKRGIRRMCWLLPARMRISKLILRIYVLARTTLSLVWLRLDAARKRDRPSACKNDATNWSSICWMWRPTGSR